MGSKETKEMSNIKLSKLVKVCDLTGTDVEDLDEQLIYIEEAKAYLQEHKWCKSIVESWYDKGWAGILTITLFEIIPNEKGVDNFVWVIAGDLPPVYIDIESATNGTCALKAYTVIVRDWLECVFNGNGVDDCYPINVPPTKEYAKMLKSRVDFIETEILTMFPEDLKEYSL